MLAFRAGDVSPLIVLDDALAKRHREMQDRRAARIAKRARSSNVPMDDGDGAGPLKPLDPYTPNADFSTVKISIRALSTDENANLARAVSDAWAAEDTGDLFAVRKAMRAWVTAAVAKIEGIVDGDGRAIGVDDIEMPATAERVWQAIQATGRNAG